MRTESDQIVSFSASSDAGRVIIGIGVGLGARSLEDPGIHRGLAGLWASVGPGAAVPRGVKCGAGALAGHHALLAYGAHGVEVTHAPCVAAFPRSLERGDGDGQVVTVHQAHVVEVLLVAQGELRQGGRWGTAYAVAEEGPTAVASGAAPAAGGVEGAAVAAPEAPRPESWELECVGFVWWELEASAGKNGLSCTGLDPGPHWM
ncbi:hypothetical protein CR513_13447, partial [Mucuna pruriens]